MESKKRVILHYDQYIPREDPRISHVQHVMIWARAGSLSEISNAVQSIELLIFFSNFSWDNTLFDKNINKCHVIIGIKYRCLWYIGRSPFGYFGETWCHNPRALRYDVTFHQNIPRETCQYIRATIFYSLSIEFMLTNNEQCGKLMSRDIQC